MDTIRLILPFPPSVNGAYATVIKGRKPIRIKSTKLKEWIKAAPIFEDIKANEDVFISYNLYFPDNRARDGQNYMKVVLDYIVEQGILEDDNRKFVRGEQWLDMGNDLENPRVELIIKGVDNIWETMRKAMIYMADTWKPKLEPKEKSNET